MRQPCPGLPDCNDPSTGDPCYFGCTEDGQCIENHNEPQEENPVQGMNIDFLLFGQLNAYLEPDLTYEQTQWILDEDHPENFYFAQELLDYLNMQEEDTHDFDDAIYSFFLEEKIIDDTLPQCLQNLVDDITALEDNAMTEVIQAFTGDSNLELDYNWNLLQSSDQSYFTNGNNLGNTESALRSGYAWTRLNSVALANATDLLYVQTILHEMIHAYMVNYYSKNPWPPVSDEEFQSYEYSEMVMSFMTNEMSIVKLNMNNL